MERVSRAVALWVVCAVALAAAMWHFGHRQMGALDDNIIIDTAWRMFIGQRPYLDFSVPLSPEFYLGAGWAFRLWGVNWSALVRVSVVFAVFVFALQSIALSHFLPRRYAISISLVCQMLAMMITSYWWYNSNAAVTACLLFSVSLALVIRPGSKTLGIIFCVTLTMLSVMKVNIAAVSMLVALSALMTVPQLRNKVIVWLAGSGVLVIVLLVLCHLNPLDILRAYLKMAGSRGTPDIRNILRSKPNELFVSLPLLMAWFSVFLVACRHIYRTPLDRRPPRVAQVVFLTSAGMAVGAWCIVMSTEQSLISGSPLIVLSSSSLVLWAMKEKVVDTAAPLALTVAVLLSGGAAMLGMVLFERLPFGVLVGPIGYTQPYLAMLITWSAFLLMSVAAYAGSFAVLPAPHWRWVEKVQGWSTILVVVLLTSGVAAVYVSAKRLRVGINGDGLFYSSGPAVVVDLPFFRGFFVSSQLRTVAEQIRLVLAQYQARGYDTAHVFFGLRLEFAYAAFGIPSPIRMPVWWDPAAAYAPSEEPQIVERFVAHRFPLCIFYGKDPDFTFLPKGIVNELNGQYQRVAYSEVTVFVRNTGR